MGGPTIDDVFELLDRAYDDAEAARQPELDIDFDEEYGFPADVRFSDRMPDAWYGFGIAGFEVIEARPPDP